MPGREAVNDVSESDHAKVRSALGCELALRLLGALVVALQAHLSTHIVLLGAIDDPGAMNVIAKHHREHILKSRLGCASHLAERSALGDIPCRSDELEHRE